MKRFAFIWLGFLLVSSVQAQRIADTLTVHFPFDKAVLTASAQNKILNWHRAGLGQVVKLKLKGHCDAIGSDLYNDELSNRRVRAVQQFLIRNGMADSNIVLAEGYGERVPLNQNMTAVQRQQNRRVEIILQTEKAGNGISKTPIISKDSSTEVLKASIEKVQEGQTLRLRNINFYGGRHTFLSQSYPALQELLEVMKSHPTLIIEIQGHICCRFDLPGDGDDYDAGDKNLSYNRARAVYRYLVEGGIDPQRMSYKGFGAKVPLIYPEYTDTDRTLNRRVEIKIIKR